jgi:hypothetical protein
MDQILLKQKLKQIKRAQAWQALRPLVIMAGRVCCGVVIGAGWLVMMYEFVLLNNILNK